jgi:branched-chain amino acid transport system ATP-binding protein
VQAVIGPAAHIYKLSNGRIIVNGPRAAIAVNPALIDPYLSHGAAARLKPGPRHHGNGQHARTRRPGVAPV